MSGQRLSRLVLGCVGARRSSCQNGAAEKVFYKAALDAKEVPPEITRQLGAWAPVAGDTPYSRMNKAQINNARKRLVNSNENFLEITW